MNNLFNGQCTMAQARAVRAYLESYDGLDAAWKDGEYHYLADISEWHNCRERGYVITMLNGKYGTKSNGKQLNIAFFEHRNSDDICAVAWVQHVTINPPTIDTAEFGEIYKTKWDVSHTVRYGEAHKMAKWIVSRMEEHYANQIDA